MTKLDVYCDGYSITTREPDPDDDWDRGDTMFASTGIRAVLQDGGRFDLPVAPGDTVYAIVGVYDTGDTFGRDDQQHDVLGAFKSMAKAYAVYEKYRQFTPRAIGNRPGPLVQWGFEHDGVHYYVPWLGYFESYVDCYVTSVTVQLDTRGRVW